MKVSYYFQDTEGKWTREKKEQAFLNISERCPSKGEAAAIVVVYLEPVAQPVKGAPILFQYSAYAETNDNAESKSPH